MDRFSDKVFGLLVWRAFLTTLIAILLTIARDLPFELRLSQAPMWHCCSRSV